MCDTQLFIYIFNGLLREHSVNHAATYKKAGLGAVPLEYKYPESEPLTGQ